MSLPDTNFDEIKLKSNPLREWLENNRLERYGFMSSEQLRSRPLLNVSMLGWVGQTQEEWGEPFKDRARMQQKVNMRTQDNNSKIDSILELSAKMDEKLRDKQRKEGFSEEEYEARLERNLKNIIKPFERDSRPGETLYKKNPPPFPLDQKVIKAKAQATQEEILEDYYEHTPYPTPEQYDELAKESGMDRKKIPKWFQKKRKRSANTPTPVRRPKKQAKTLPTLIELLDTTYKEVDNNKRLRIKNYNQERDFNGNTALHYAAAFNSDTKAVTILLKRLTPEERDYTNRFGWTALDAAYARTNNKNDIGGEGIKRLLEVNDVHRGDEKFIHHKTRARSNSFELLKFKF